MTKLRIREANDSDKISVLKFCKNTFSWGDYVEQVWNFWISEGHLFLGQKPEPVGICHAFYSGNQVWIEGIRIESTFRRQNIASELVKHAEITGLAKNLSFSYMLIDTENPASVSMAQSLNYEIFQTWNFYSIEPRNNSNYNVTFEKSIDSKFLSHYVKSWRWLPIDDVTLESFYEQNRIVNSSIDNKNSIAIITESEHFDRTLIVTLFSDSDESVCEILSFLQNFGWANNYKKIQILTKEKLPNFDSLESKISFHLMKKSLV
ncbi:MAG: GNAT family N-acetyltransferase [Nitrosopumilus sp.]|nr:GNAT family N-acetyltransferase [Nitrosopumilus sp.]